MRLLTVDVGNTSLYAALFEGARVIRRFRLPTARFSGAAVERLARRFPSADAAIIGSVVPSVGRLLRRNLPKAAGYPAFLLGRDLEVPIRNRYRDPRQVGQDRLLNALAAYSRYRRECIVIDFGTAVTFDVVSRKGEYLGGVIAPGIEITLEALFRRTALLPRIRLAHPRSVVGRDTAESIRAGCAYGIGGLCERLVREITRQCRFHRPLILATGGYARFMRRYYPGIRHIDPDLTVRGLFLAYRAFRSAR